MKKQILLSMLLSCLYMIALAQEQSIVKGKIEFEKKVNMHKQVDFIEDEDWRNMVKKMIPPTKTAYFDLYFSGNKTIYTPGREVIVTQRSSEWLEGPATDNIVFTDIDQQSAVSQKTVYDNIFNVQDSVRKINWKITPDTRTIAGMECRKATAVILDTVFVVAFYAEQIVTPGGPESFAGLPGMILGLAVPRLFTTWFATKLELTDVKESMLVPPRKGKKANANDIQAQLKTSMKDQAKMGAQFMLQLRI